jgi:nucleoid DNA-binding protein
MNKKELIVRVSEKLGGISQKAAAETIEAVFESIAEGLQEDGVVTILGRRYGLIWDSGGKELEIHSAFAQQFP